MNPILDEIKEKYGEWLEMAGEDSPALLADILCSLLQKERDSIEYYKKLLRSKERNHVCACTTN